MSARDDDDAQDGAPEWVVTYGDMMSLLLTFFIMLVSMSELKDDGRIRAMLDALRERFGSTAGIAGVPGSSLAQTSSMTRHRSESKRSEGGVKRRSRKAEGLAGPQAALQRINHGTVISLGGPTHFQPSDAGLSESLKQSLDVIAEVLRQHSQRLVVRGHASPEPLPPGSPHRDPWDLSFARAHNVAEYLAGRGIDRSRLLVSAAGDTEPRLPYTWKERRQQNHRVDVFLIDSYTTPPPAD